MLRVVLLSAIILLSLRANGSKEGLNYLNQIRSNAGLIKLKENRALRTAATSHSKYLIKNQKSGHYEKRGKRAYTGKTPSARVLKAGYPSAYVMENISLNTPGYIKSIETLFSAIYHRFVFLNLDKDEIGLGRYKTTEKRKIKEAYVYNLSSSKIAKLCAGTFSKKSGSYYVNEICRKSDKMIPRRLFRAKKAEIQNQNKNMILYPYPGQKDIWPAFYNESPDPLPNYDVSGFPISVQFNPAHTKTVKLKSFRLYNSKGKKLNHTKILQKNNDVNHLFTELEFALMPLKRLEYNTRYTAVFEALVNGKKVKKQWSFSTKKFDYRVYSVKDTKTTLTVKSGETIILYMVPNSPKDTLRSYRSRGSLKVSFLDQNTLKVILPKRRSSGRVHLTLGKKRVFFTIK